ncbi:hypothetical protein GCM10023206_01490 [Acinetobacter puyangensis]|uniref:Signal peptide-containing protein n=1 Tax=Acinetobacter puyangensis TaxID=1096779 RepID=A0A240E7K8_9GAMM|nr:hypothetical protein [Acinetobacter puyangensis]SNX44501.1 hypothetical protein SAMN05421731_103239 [Acinetobacter puyangensis]
MNIKLILLTAASCIAFAACHHAPTHNAKENGQLVQKIENLQAVPASDSNDAKLYQLDKGCAIEFTGFYETGKATETWSFQGKQLLSAKSVISTYVDHGLNQTNNFDQPIKIASQQHKNFDIHDADTQKNFQSLLGYFKDDELQKCQ